MSKEDNRRFGELGMQIASNKDRWMLRALIMAKMLNARGVDVEHILKETDKAKIMRVLEEQEGNK